MKFFLEEIQTLELQKRSTVDKQALAEGSTVL
jgi:hypothetical protein